MASVGIRDVKKAFGTTQVIHGVDITIGDGRLHIHAERRAEKTTDDKSGYKSEFQYGSFERSMRMPPGATESDVTASYKDGILTVRIPQREEAKAKQITVE